eukprot:CAMPEP_0184857526 /NCGR_PEP_ID=MMETSP0580-20130426/2678_1 /TAXON_ID=1118495 /ORGANISM="Dactyliosolen fragilissimus" /LENGTH=287 /DNA_ID=CAMNT_0027353165 /DNA_START=200 /DNA_END=1063 /DNA_ORIENTATION=+
MVEKYGKGTEIYPPTNEGIIRLEDSFPNGILPSMASSTISNLEAENEETPTKFSYTISDVTSEIEESSQFVTNKGRKRKLIKTALKRILQSAAISEKRRSSNEIDDAQQLFSLTTPYFPQNGLKLPTIICLSLVFLRLIPPRDILLVTFFSGYITVLELISSFPSLSTPSSSFVASSLMPSLPPQGHVPYLVSNPLGKCMTQSRVYRAWLTVGSLLGLWVPFLVSIWYKIGSVDAFSNLLNTWGILVTGNVHVMAASSAARPVFLLCCQVMSEVAMRRAMVRDLHYC